jgi:uncharacterized membrane protein
MSGDPPVPAPPPVPQGGVDVIPQPVAPKRKWYQVGWRSIEIDDRNQIERDSSQSHNIRRIVAYGAMTMVLVMYVAGLFAIGYFLGLTPFAKPVSADLWHIVVAVLVALFTVPTVLAISVMRLAAARPEEVPKTVHEWLGKVAEKGVEKLMGE